MIKSFVDLDAWKRGHELVLGIYKLTSAFPKNETFGLISQIKRAAVSVTSNIAEGFARYSLKEKIRFYFISQGSLAEVQNQLMIARDLKYITPNDCEKCLQLAQDTSQIIHGLIRSIKANFPRTTNS